MDLRDWINDLKKIGELKEIEGEVDWNLEAAAISCMSNRVNGPAMWFKKIKGYPEGYTLLGEPLAGSWRRPWSRVAYALGMQPDVSFEEFGREEIRRLYSRIKPVVVSSGECKENILLGKDVNLLKFPWTYTHMEDGGRFGVLQNWVMQDPDTGFVNWGIYRMMIHGKAVAGCRVSGGQDGFFIMTKWHAQGKACPVAVFIGGDIANIICATYAAPYGTPEAEIAGGLRQAPAELIKCETNDLYVPANAEIVLEGEVRPGEQWDEGPFGEMVGYMEGPRFPTNVFRINCITYRNNPIIPFTVEGTQVNTAQALQSAFGLEMWRNQRIRNRFPVRAIFPTTSCAPGGWITSTEKPYPGYAKQLMSALLEGRHMGGGRFFLVSAHIDPSDLDEVTESWALDCNPAEDIHVFQDNPVTTYQAWVSAEEKRNAPALLTVQGHYLFYDCTEKVDAPKVKFETALSKEAQQFVKERWQALGFEEPLEVKAREYEIREAVRDVGE
jgi:UbiD family decarboxylase